MVKILYVHFKPANSNLQIKALADKVKLLKEVSDGHYNLNQTL